MSLAGKVALVTGSTQGIGLGMLRALAGAGAGKKRREGCGFGPRGLRVRTLQSPARDNATLQLGPCGGCASSPRRNRAVLSPQAPTGTITGRGTHSLTRARLNPVPSLGVSAAAAARLTPRSLLLF